MLKPWEITYAKALFQDYFPFARMGYAIMIDYVNSWEGIGLRSGDFEA